MHEFVPLSTLLLPDAKGEEIELPPSEPMEIGNHVTESAPPAMLWCDEVAREARLFRAHLREQLEEAQIILLERIAKEIVGRELALAPIELRRIVDRAVADYCADGPLRIRVSPPDLPKFCDHPLPAFPDETLDRGDVILELQNGVVDLRLAARLESVLNAP